MSELDRANAEIAHLRAVVEAQGKVVDAARKYVGAVRDAHGVHVPWEAVDELIYAMHAFDKTDQC